MLEISGFMSAYLRTELQRAEYVERYGEFPTNKDLNNLFFLTDLRIEGKNEILFVDQLQLSQNLYTLATYYPEYYKLGENHTLGSEKYNDMLKELKSEVNKDFFASAIRGKTHIKDAILNGAIEQAIYEIKGMPGQISTAASIENDDWYAFTNQINELACSISLIYNYSLRADRSNISKLVHMERNAFNRIPDTFGELLKNTEGWNRQLVVGSGYHMFDDGTYAIKFYHDSGSEAVYHSKTGELIENNSTYNYGSQSNLASSINGAHKMLDMNTHEKWGLSEEIGPSGVEAGDAFWQSIKVSTESEYKDEQNSYKEAKKLFEEAKAREGKSKAIGSKNTNMN